MPGPIGSLFDSWEAVREASEALTRALSHEQEAILAVRDAVLSESLRRSEGGEPDAARCLALWLAAHDRAHDVGDARVALDDALSAFLQHDRPGPPRLAPDEVVGALMQLNAAAPELLRERIAHLEAENRALRLQVESLPPEPAQD